MLPYQYPLGEVYPVVRIDVTGPEPFNTLVCVRGVFPVVFGGWSLGKLHRWRALCVTPFILRGFVQDDTEQPPSLHSTTGALQMIQQGPDVEIFADAGGSFVYAVDAAGRGYFTSDGHWAVEMDVADLALDTIATARAYLSSWVLCWEPPRPKKPYLKKYIGQIRIEGEAELPHAISTALQPLHGPHSERGVRKAASPVRKRKQRERRKPDCD